MLKTKVKISNVTNLSDARYCAGMGVEMIGFSMDNFPFETYKEIRGWLSGVQIVGETSEEDFLKINELKEQFLPDMIQVNHWDNLQEIKKLGLPIILKVDFAKDNLPALFQSTVADVDYFLLESSDDFSRLDDATISQIDSWSFKYPILLAFGISDKNVEQILAETNIEGIAIEGTEEERPGYKDFTEMMDLMEALEEE
jgi:phosphoribosylanthranilate isomerase